ncbi:MAG: alpha/beta fold hydrolase [Dehalococcoidia bacterium]
MPFLQIDEQLNMFYEDQDFSEPWNDSEVILMHHGNAKNSQFWYGWLPELSRNYRVIRVDGRGFGKSSIPSKNYGWSLEQFAQDSKTLLDLLNTPKVHFIGETIGGSIGMVFAEMFPEATKSLTVCTSPYNFSAVETYKEYHTLVGVEGVRAWVEKTSGQRLPGKSADHNQWYIDQMSNTSKQVVMETLSYLSTVDLTDRLMNILCPTLIMVGENSAMNTNGRVDSLAQLISDSKIIKVAGATGYVQHSEPEQCAQEWIQFARSLRS